MLVVRDYSSAGALLSVFVEPGWPHDEEAAQGLGWHLRALERDPNEMLWRIRLIVDCSSRIVMGSINLKGGPDESGTVEIGWGVSEQYRRQGIATRATNAVIELVLAQRGVKRVIATIPPENEGSIRVAERIGMKRREELVRGLPVWSIERSSGATEPGS
jgi:ribosomal-protein-alanine N-acetyltransferase